MGKLMSSSGRLLAAANDDDGVDDNGHRVSRGIQFK